MLQERHALSENARVTSFPFSQLWSQVRRKSRMWLFKRRDIELAAKWQKAHTQVARTTILSSSEVEQAIAWVAELQGGKLVRMDVYFSWADGLEAAGLSE